MSVVPGYALPNMGLVLLCAVQLGTGLLIFSRKEVLMGMESLPGPFSHYRYMLSALWSSIGTVYLMGALDPVIEPGAVLLALVNACLEIAGYWLSARSGLLPRRFAALSTLVMGGGAALSVICYFSLAV